MNICYISVNAESPITGPILPSRTNSPPAEVSSEVQCSNKMVDIVYLILLWTTWFFFVFIVKRLESEIIHSLWYENRMA
jgi:hypothetical protein